MRLDELLEGVDVRTTHGDVSGIHVMAVTHDSATVAPGTLFCAIRGASADGHDFAADAVARGAVAVMGERLVAVTVPQIVVAESRPALAAVAAALNGHPSRAITLVGVTGTNGKTTTTYLLKAIFDAAGMRCGVIGSISGARTTPEAPALQSELARLRDDGHIAVAMEVSSAALVAHRVDAVRFAAAVFTNLGRDHLGEVHPTMDDYFEAKARLFAPGLAGLAVINGDDPYGERLAGAIDLPVHRFAMRDANQLVIEARGSRFIWRGVQIALPFPGKFNVMNAMAAATTASALGVDVDNIAAGLAGAPTVPGHFEWVDAGQPFNVAVDYAHTPEALEHALHAARDVAAGGRVIVVFGCGGDRDPGKRAPMGLAAARLADVAVVTSDNPRHEDPDAIIAEVVNGVGSRDNVFIEPDRTHAIAMALKAAEPGDVVLVAGKGHETGQQIGDAVLPFDDREIVRRELQPWRAAT